MSDELYKRILDSIYDGVYLVDPDRRITRRLIESSGFTEGEVTIHVTISVGGVMAAAGENPEAAIRRADRLMLASKTAGRNRVTIGDLPGPG